MGTAPAIAQMEQSGVLVAGSRVDLGRTLTGICVRAGTPMPDISTPDRFKQAMLEARSVAYTNPQAGGTSGIFLVGLLGRLGIAEAVGKKALLCINGDEVVDKVSAGDAEIGSTFLSEIVPMKAVKAVGPLPAADWKRHRLCRRHHGGEQQPRGGRQVHRDADRARRNGSPGCRCGFEPAGRG